MAKKRISRAPVRPVSPRAVSTTALWPDAVNLSLLAGLAIYLGYSSWLLWPDPLIDFGRELFLPWRITQGDILYKDVLHLYGPLSAYINSLFFRIGGAGLTTLVTANALIYTVILALLYYLVRTAWGRWAAFASSAFFVGAFSFSHLVGVANYNFLTPYSHEMTHGMLLILCLVLVLRKAVRLLQPVDVAISGLLAGLTVLLKPEIIFTASVVVAGAIFLIVRRNSHNQPWGKLARTSAIFLAAGLTPMIVATLLLWLRGGFSLISALHFANYAWFVVFEARSLYSEPFQLAALGVDHPWQNLANELAWSAAVLVFAAALAWGTAFFRRTANLQKIVLLVLLIAAGVAATRVPWVNFGSAFPGILLFGAVIEIASARTASENTNDIATTRVLLWLAAAAMLARMPLNSRIFHYGFVQAALAGTIGVAILMSSLPKYLKLDGTAQKWYQAMMTFLLAFVVWGLVSRSMTINSRETQLVGEGVDRFFSFDQSINPTGLLVEEARKFLYRDSRENNVHSLLVLPEGTMLNYLTRIPTSTPYYFFGPFVLANGRQDEILRQLAAAPPDRIVILSRDMREFGVERFGDSPEHGQNLIDFIKQNYRGLFKFGDTDLLDPDQFGLLVLAHKTNP